MAIGSVPPVIPEAPVPVGHPGRTTARPGGPENGGADAGSGAPAGTPEGAGVVSPATPLDRLIAAALIRQDGLAALFASAAALARSADDLPEAVVAALAKLAGLAISVPPDAAAVRSALAGFGLFHEALALVGDAGARGDLKAALAELRGALAAALASLPARPKLDPDRPRRQSPPPRPGLLPPAEPAAPPPDDLETASLVRRLIADVDHALARIALHQTSALEEARSRGDGHRPAALTAEIPIAGPAAQGAGISLATIRIERDDHGGREREPATEGPTFRVEIALSVDPLGPVSARVALLPGRRIVAGLWCERPEAVAPLQAGLAAFRLALEGAGLEVGAVDVHIGRPPPRPPLAAPPAHRVDVAI